MKIAFRPETWDFASAFRIAYKTRTRAETLVVELRDQGAVGRGEALGVSYHGETVESMVGDLTNVADRLKDGVTREELQLLLPPGGARNALDCAMWDLDAKREGQRAWALAAIPSVRALRTAYTLGIDTPPAMSLIAAKAVGYPLLKLKLAGDGADLDRVSAVRAARPDARLIVDANQSWGERQLREVMPILVGLDIKLIEQPLPVDQDDALRDFVSPIPLCADESCQTRESLSRLTGKYQYINIKLDKTGGLTEGLRLARAAKEQGFKLMIGCMGGTSLSMAPAFIVGQLCEFVDLDGPLLLQSDILDGIRYLDDQMSPPKTILWG